MGSCYAVGGKTGFTHRHHDVQDIEATLAFDGRRDSHGGELARRDTERVRHCINTAHITLLRHPETPLVPELEPFEFDTHVRVGGDRDVAGDSSLEAAVYRATNL